MRGGPGLDSLQVLETAFFDGTARKAAPLEGLTATRGGMPERRKGDTELVPLSPHT